MKVIYNNYIPFKGFKLMNLFGILFARKEYFRTISKRDINHEKIHTAQIIELAFIFFYILYLGEWLFRLLFTKDRFSKQAYYNISFEKEAYNNEDNLEYLKHRKHYAWIFNKAVD